MTQEPKYKSYISYKELFFDFLKIGTIGFGGGLVVIGIIQSNFVNKKRLISPDDFFIGTSLSQFIGAFAVNTTYYIGKRLKGIPGGVVSVISFLLPSFFTVLILTHLYKNHHQIINIKSIIENVMPIIIAILIITAVKFFVYYKSTPIITLITCIITLPSLIFFENYIISLVVGGTVYSLLIKSKKDYTLTNTLLPLNGVVTDRIPTFPYLAIPQIVITWLATPTLFKLSILCLVIGFIFFGGGYSLAPIIQHIFVQKLKWIPNDAFIIGMIISQITPGPFAIIATFLGYYLFGIIGAVISTLLIFLPSLLILEIIINFYDSYQRNLWLRNFVKGLGIVVGLMILKLSLNFTIEYIWFPTLFEVIAFILSLIILSLGYSPAIPIICSLLYTLIINISTLF